MFNTELRELLEQSCGGKNETFCDDTASVQTAQIFRHVLRMPDDSATDDSREDASVTIGLWQEWVRVNEKWLENFKEDEFGFRINENS